MEKQSKEQSKEQIETKRTTTIKRKTFETDINLSLTLEGEGKVTGSTGIGFLDHMLVLMGKHGQMNIDLQCKGDLEVDNHHLVEDLGICLGLAFKEVLGDKVGLKRYSTTFTPMDEALIMISLDLSGRSFLNLDCEFSREKVGEFETETLKEFLRGFVLNGGITLHIKRMYGENTHHMIEAIFKGLGRGLREAVTIDSNIKGVLSTKGML